MSAYCLPPPNLALSPFVPRWKTLAPPMLQNEICGSSGLFAAIFYSWLPICQEAHAVVCCFTPIFLDEFKALSNKLLNVEVHLFCSPKFVANSPCQSPADGHVIMFKYSLCRKFIYKVLKNHGSIWCGKKRMSKKELWGYFPPLERKGLIWKRLLHEASHGRELLITRWQQVVVKCSLIWSVLVRES